MTPDCKRHAHVATPTLRGQGFVEMERGGCWVHYLPRASLPSPFFTGRGRGWGSSGLQKRRRPTPNPSPQVDRDVPALRPSRTHDDGQRLALGRRPLRRRLHASDGLADAPGRALRAFPALPSADPRQGRADAPIDARRGDAKRFATTWRIGRPPSTPGASSTTPRGRIRRSITTCPRKKRRGGELARLILPLLCLYMKTATTQKPGPVRGHGAFLFM